ncbi:D-2-hydroxyacid dehydrogenase family protein [Bordetella sp. N]|uniref:D-2-hydroxyacid dehydrogenase family protein n=1 Tax=Bordetella sp. N TaxID=1746199 RepID=UPI00070D77A9|nr:D-2-hydroxyacid dehydrogenase family protein [Bordetella sp. N]ALM85129.1 hydroxyacid dehydrogenase [Bordetella sp. N]
MNIAILDDYHGVAADYADWSKLGPQAKIKVFREYLPEAERAAALQSFDVIVIMRERTPFPAALINALPNLRLLVTTGLRNNAVDLAACKARGITVSGAPGAADAVTATSELAWTLILGLFKNLCTEDVNMRRGGWQTGMPLPLAGKRLGLLGLGKLGQAVARYGKAFEMDVVAWSPNLTPERAQEGGATYVSKEDLFATSDVVSIHLILSDRTRNVVDAGAFQAMKPTAFLVNTSRAGLVDQDALMAALRHKRIAAAGLDVYSVEPLPADDPIRQLDNVVLTPHLGYVSEDNFRAYYVNVVDAIEAWAAGKPIREL